MVIEPLIVFLRCQNANQWAEPFIHLIKFPEVKCSATLTQGKYMLITGFSRKEENSNKVMLSEV